MSDSDSPSSSLSPPTSIHQFHDGITESSSYPFPSSPPNDNLLEEMQRKLTLNSTSDTTNGTPNENHTSHPHDGNSSPSSSPSLPTSNDNSNDRNNNIISYDVCGDHIEWLTIMSSRYSLSSDSLSLSSPLLLTLNYILSLEEYDQKVVFTRIRCKHCGIKFDKKKIKVNLPKYVRDFVMEMKVKYDIPDESKVIRIVLDYIQWGKVKRGMKDEEIRELVQQTEGKVFGEKKYDHEKENGKGKDSQNGKEDVKEEK